MATIPVLQTLVALLLAVFFSFSSASNFMMTGDVLKAGQNLTYKSYSLTLQSDCNLVLRDGNISIWTTMTNGYGRGCYLTLDRQGELILWTSYKYAIWTSGKVSNVAGTYCLVLRYDSTLQIYGPELWIAKSSSVVTTGGAAGMLGLTKTTDSVLYSGDVAPIGTTIVNGDSELTLQDDCNLVLTFKGETKWQTGVTDDTLHDCFVNLEANGELIVKHWGGDFLWRNNVTSPTRAEFVLVLQANAKLGVYGPGIWDNTASGRVHNSDKIAMVTAAE